MVDSVSVKEYRDLYHEFGYEEAISKDKASLSYLVAASDDLWLLMLDTNEYKSNAVLTFKAGKDFVYRARTVDVEGWDKATNQSNEKLLNFTDYSKNLYIESAYKKAYDRLLDLDLYSEEEKMEMAKTVSIINAARFDGEEKSIKKEVMDSKGYELWVKADADVPNKDRVMNAVREPRINIITKSKEADNHYLKIDIKN